MIPKNSIVKYIRKNKTPIGVMVAIKTADGFRFGYSLCNRKDKFNKEMALKIAFGRAESHENYEVVPHVIAKNHDEFIDRCNRYYKIKS
jgi:hypothetical protein